MKYFKYLYLILCVSLLLSCGSDKGPIDSIESEGIPNTVAGIVRITSGDIKVGERHEFASGTRHPDATYKWTVNNGGQIGTDYKGDYADYSPSVFIKFPSKGEYTIKVQITNYNGAGNDQGVIFTLTEFVK